MSAFFEEAVRRTLLRFPDRYWEVLTPTQRADAIWEEIHRIDRSGGLQRVAQSQKVDEQADANLKHPAEQVVAGRRSHAA